MPEIIDPFEQKTTPLLADTGGIIDPFEPGLRPVEEQPLSEPLLSQEQAEQPKLRYIPPDVQAYFDSVKEPQKEADKVKSAISNSIFLGIPPSAAYSFNDAIVNEQKKRGIEIEKFKGTSTLGISPHKEIMRQQEIKEVRGEIKKAPTEFPRGIISGALGTAESGLSAVEWLFDDVPGINKLATMAEEASTELEKMRTSPEFATDSVVGDIGSAFGSMGTFLIPGTIVGKGLSMITGVAPKLAMWLGVSTMAAFEALTEAGGVFKERKRVAEREDFEDPKSEAETAAQFTFWTNIPLLLVTNKLGVFADKGGTVKKAIKAYFFEGLGQESPQAIISSLAIADPSNPLTVNDVLYEGVIGGFAGAGGSLLLSHIENLSDKARNLKEMPMAVKTVYEGTVDGLEALGIDSETAHIEATKAVARTKQGEEYIKQVADTVEDIIATEATVAKVEKEAQEINTAIDEAGKNAIDTALKEPIPLTEEITPESLEHAIDTFIQSEGMENLTDDEVFTQLEKIEAGEEVEAAPAPIETLKVEERAEEQITPSMIPASLEVEVMTIGAKTGKKASTRGNARRTFAKNEAMTKKYQALLDCLGV